jgi:predicted DNA-binding transcriptional regulator AlpA
MSRCTSRRAPGAGAAGLPVGQWGREHFGITTSTAYRYLESDDPPPLVMTPTGRRLVAVNSPEYAEWLARRTIVQKDAVAACPIGSAGRGRHP